MKPVLAEEQKTSVAERRKFPRVPRNVSVETSKLVFPITDDEQSAGRSANISAGGVLTTLTEQYEPGTLLQIKITLPGWRKYHPGFIRVYENSIGSPFTAVCEVLRTTKRGSGYDTAVRFLNVDHDDFTALKEYLEREMRN
jgi:hypothetical protein